MAAKTRQKPDKDTVMAWVMIIGIFVILVLYGYFRFYHHIGQTLVLNYAHRSGNEWNVLLGGPSGNLRTAKLWEYGVDFLAFGAVMLAFLRFKIGSRVLKLPSPLPAWIFVLATLFVLDNGPFPVTFFGRSFGSGGTTNNASLIHEHIAYQIGPQLDHALINAELAGIIIFFVSCLTNAFLLLNYAQRYNGETLPIAIKTRAKFLGLSLLWWVIGLAIII